MAAVPCCTQRRSDPKGLDRFLRLSRRFDCGGPPDGLFVGPTVSQTTMEDRDEPIDQSAQGLIVSLCPVFAAGRS